MEVPRLVLSIEGGYVDSYIYSGFLLLVDDDYHLSVFKWEELFKEVLAGVKAMESMLIRNLLLDSRKAIPKVAEAELVVTRENLQSARICTFDIGVWPSDIKIYSNKIYISSENGIQIVKIDYGTGMLSGEKSIYDEMCFSVAPNSFNRLAFAAGNSGVFLLQPSSRYKYDSNDVKQLVDGLCVDLDWQSTKLLANTAEGVVEATFEKIPLKKDYEDPRDYDAALNERLAMQPALQINEKVEKAWVAGDRVFSFDKNGQLTSASIVGDNSIRTDFLNIKEKLLRARTAAFGTVFEFNNALIALIGNEEIHLAHETVGWRVFPRARNYANQLHIVKENRIEITIIESVDNNFYGFDTDKISSLD